MKNRKGVSLLVLIVTIIVIMILISVVVISVGSAIQSAEVSTFTRNLTMIQEGTESHYIMYGAMPKKEDTLVLDSNALLDMAQDSALLLEELTENNDVDSQFYVVDLAKINVTRVEYGNGVRGEHDIFVVSFPSMIAYYPYGISAQNTVYYSITSKISSVVRIYSEEIDPSITTTVSSGGIVVTQNIGWVNTMGVNISVDMATGETLYMSVSGDTNRLITTVVGNNSFGFDLLSSIVTDSETIKVPTLTLAEANYIEQGTKPIQERYVDILKYKDADLIGKVRIDLSNFSKVEPLVTSETYTSYDNINTVTLLLEGPESGIKQIRYEYLTKFNELATVENYYTGISDFNLSYMQSRARISKLESNMTTTISAPKNVNTIKVLIEDKAGNTNLFNQEIAPRLYIGHTVDSSTQLSLQLTANMFSINGIKSATFSISTDGINYTDSQVFNINSTVNGVTTQQCNPFTDIIANVVYVKIVAVNFNETLTETRIVEINLD